jgi:predicted MPP superfamily phosphohydrolase
MRFVHISDLHFQESNRSDITKILNAFETSLKAEAERAPVDVVFFTGDLVNSGDSADDFATAGNMVSQAVGRACGVSQTNLIICPGNHDLSQKAFRADDITDIALTAKLSNVASTNSFLENSSTNPYLDLSLRPLANYYHFEEYHYGDMPLSPHRLIRTRTMVVDGRQIGICIFNSAWRSTAGAGNDLKRLIIGERLIDLALDQVLTADLRIAVVHHPLDWLADFDQQAVEGLLFQKFDFYLCGHIHAAQPHAKIGISGPMIVSQCGALFSHRDYFNGYQIADVNFDTESVQFHIFEWSNRIRQFTRCVSLLPETNGTVTLPLRRSDGRTETERVGSILRLAKRNIRTKANDHVTLHRTRPEGADDIKEVFVCPPLQHKRDPALATPGHDGNALAITAESVLLSDRNYAVFGDRDAGKTSLGFLFAVLASDGICDKPRLPAVIDASTIRRYPQQISGRVRGFLCPDDDSYPRLQALTEQLVSVRDLPLLLIIDNVVVRDKNRLAEIEKILREVPDCRWILLCVQDETTRTVDLAGAFSNPTVILFMQDLPRRAIREISRRRNELIDEDVQRIFPKVMDSLAAAGLPKNGYIVSLLSWVAAQGGGIDTINEATLIRTIIDHLLERGRFDALLRRSLDPEFKEIVLSEIAYYMRSHNEPVLYNDVLSFIIAFFAKRNLSFEADRVLRALQDCRILDVTDEYALFRLPCYQDYFVARYLRDNPSALAHIKESGEHALWARELDILTSLTRRDFGLLSEIELALERVRPDVALHLNAAGFSTYKFNTPIDAPSLRRLKRSKLTQDVIDDMQDNAEARAVDKSSNEPSTVKHTITATSEYYTMMSLLGKVARNSEAAEGTAKEKAIGKYVEHHLHLINTVSKFISEQAPRLEASLSGDDKQKDNRSVIDITLYLLHVIVPISLLKLAARDIGTTKLLDTFRKNTLAHSDNDEIRLIYAFIAFAISTLEGIQAMRSIVQTDNATILRIIQMKVILSYSTNDYDAKYQTELEKFISEMEQKLGGAPVSVQTLKTRAAARTISESGDMGVG